MRIFPVVLLLAAALPAPRGGVAQPPVQAIPSGAQPAGDTLPSAVAAAFSSVVSIRVREMVRVPVFRNGRFRNEPVEGLGAGSGVVIGDDGTIVTNAHVVAGGGDVHVRRSDGREVEARVLSIDEASDLALLRAPADGLRALDLSDDAAPPEGAKVFVLGNRGDTGTEVAWARIGAHRHLRVGARPLEFWCEVEASIGPGDSGGALVDEAGRLIGIPSLLVSYTGDRPGNAAHASGLFIPLSHVRRAVTRMMKEPRPTWPWVGLLLEDPLLAASQGRPWLDDTARVRRVFPGSPAEEAGVRRGDRIVAVSGRPVRDVFEALEAVLNLETLRPASLDVERDGARLRLAVTPAPRPGDPRPDPLDDFAFDDGVRGRPVPAGADPDLDHPRRRCDGRRPEAGSCRIARRPGAPAAPLLRPGAVRGDPALDLRRPPKSRPRPGAEEDLPRRPLSQNGLTNDLETVRDSRFIPK